MFIILKKIQYGTAKRISYSENTRLFSNGGRQNIFENSKIYNSIVVIITINYYDSHVNARSTTFA